MKNIFGLKGKKVMTVMGEKRERKNHLIDKRSNDFNGYEFKHHNFSAHEINAYVRLQEFERSNGSCH